MWSKIVDCETAVFAFAVGIYRCQQSRRSFNAHARMQAAAPITIRYPAQELRVAHSALGFLNGATSDPVQN